MKATLEKVDTDFELWPENVEAVQMFCAVSTQWRVGMNGVVGLDYNALFEVMKIYGIVEQRQVFEGVRVMEGVYLAKFQSER